MMDSVEMRLVAALAAALAGEEDFAPRKRSAAELFRQRATEFAALWEVGYSPAAISALFGRAGISVSERTVVNNIKASASAVDEEERDRLARELRRRRDAASGLRAVPSVREEKTIEAAPAARPSLPAPAGPSPSGSAPAGASRVLPPASPAVSKENPSRPWQPENFVCPVDEFGRPDWEAFAEAIRKTKAQSAILSFNGKRGQFPLHKQVAVFRGKVSSWDEYELLV